jgi:hypothetical protein
VRFVAIKRAFEVLAREDPELAKPHWDYTISPDVIIIRHPEPDETINRPVRLVDESVANRSNLREYRQARRPYYTQAFLANGLFAAIARGT